MLFNEVQPSKVLHSLTFLTTLYLFNFDSLSKSKKLIVLLAAHEPSSSTTISEIVGLTESILTVLVTLNSYSPEEILALILVFK